MRITPIKTKAVLPNDNLFQILDTAIPTLEDKTVVAVTSKIIGLCEGRVIKVGTVDKEKLIAQEADYYLPSSANKYNVNMTITKNNLVAAAGIDESNGNGYYILWPKDLQKSANSIRAHLSTRFKHKHIGVIITDSKTTPLRWGVTGMTIAYSGFSPLNNFIGKPDIFGRKIQYTIVSVMDGLAAAAVLAMGETNEQTPIALIQDIPFVQFQSRNPTQKELKRIKISIEDDLYSSFLKLAPWKKGKDGK